MKYKEIGGEEFVEIKDIANIFSIHINTLYKNLSDQQIPIMVYRKEKYLRKKIVDEWIAEKDELINFKEFMQEMIDKTSSAFNVNSSRHVDYILTYAAGFEYWGATVKTNLPYIPYTQRETFISKKDVSLLKNHLYEKFALYEKNHEEKLEYLCKDKMLTIYKELVEYLKQYYKTVTKGNKSAYIEMVNFLRLTMEKDLSEYSDSEIVQYAEYAGNEMTKKGCHMFVRFYTYLQRQGKCKGETRLNFDKTIIDEKKDTEPYDLDTYMKVAYMVFNEEYWKKKKLIEKAVENNYYARTWLYHAMNFVCAWRMNDILSNVPRIDLFDEPEIVLEKIKNKEVSEQTYKNAAIQLEMLVSYSKIKPNKMQNLSKAGCLRLSIPESFKSTIGMLAILCEAHERINGSNKSLCAEKKITLKQSINFFGEEYVQVLKRTVFSNRKANKTYMTLLLEEGKKVETDGYLLASYARSHKGGINKVSEVTSRYLEAKMDGYSVHDISKVLFERGICSYIPYMLCTVIYGEEFQNKTIKQQTEDMKKLKCTPYQIENILKRDESLEVKLKEKIDEIIKWADEDNVYEMVKNALEEMTSGTCTSKNDGIYCIRKACRKECSRPQRKSCVGCGYEMYVESFLYKLKNEIFFQNELLDKAISEGEKIKRMAILEEKLYPAAYEALSVIKNVYGIDINEYKKIFLEDR